MTTAHRYHLPFSAYQWLTDRQHPLLDDIRILHLERLPFTYGEVPPFAVHFRTASDRTSWRRDCTEALGLYFDQLVSATPDPIS